MSFILEDKFENIDFTVAEFTKGEYESCIFYNCNFLKVNLSESKFIDCTFINCNSSMADTSISNFQDAKFIDCKMLGIRFDTCSDFGLSFSFNNCILNDSSFYKLKIESTIFDNCQLKSVDFTAANLSKSIFNNCDFANSIIKNTNLEKADLSTSFNFNIDPEINKIKKAKFSSFNLIGLLAKYQIIIN